MAIRPSIIYFNNKDQPVPGGDPSAVSYREQFQQIEIGGRQISVNANLFDTLATKVKNGELSVDEAAGQLGSDPSGFGFKDAISIAAGFGSQNPNNYPGGKAPNYEIGAGFVPPTQQQALKTQDAISARKNSTRGVQVGTDSQGRPVFDFGKTVDDIITSVVSSGKQINPNFTSADFENLDPSVFLQQAEASIAPEFRGKFDLVKNNLITELSNLGYDLTKKRDENQRVTEKNLETGTEELAGRGLAFSGERQRFVSDTAAAKSRADESARELAFRNAQGEVSRAEELIGTDITRNLTSTGFDNRSFSFNNENPIVGSLTSERQGLKENTAKELELQERERRAFAERSLSFS